MLVQRLPYLLVYFAALILSLVVFYYAWRNRSGTGLRLFAWSILFEVSWLIGYFFEVTSSTLAAKVFWDDFQYIGAFLAPVLLTGFALEFTDVKMNTRRLMRILSLVPVLMLIVIFSNRFPELVRVNAQIQSGMPFDELTYDFGNLSLFGNYFYALPLSFAYLGILIAGFFRRTSITRSQLSVVFMGTLIPIIGSALGIALGWQFANQRDISPLTFALSNAVIALGIFRFRLFNVIPIARQALFETIDDVLIVLDTQDHVVDANPSAMKTFGWQTKQLGSISIEDVWPGLYDQFHGINEARAEIVAADQTYYDLKITPVYDRSGNLYGRLIAAHDITSQKQVEQDLQKVSEQNKQRALQFQAIAQVASSITSVQELKKTLSQITQTLGSQLGHYHVGIFLIDSTFQFAILQAANSEGGQKMLNEGYRLKIGETGIVNAAIITRRPQLALDGDKGKTFVVNPFLANTRSEVAIPIRLSGDMIGILDIQSLNENAFADDDLEVFEILASQVGIAIQNARLYEQNIEALKETEEAYRRLSGTTWSNLIQQMDIKAYIYDGVSSRSATDAPSNTRSASLAVPVTVRGKVVGHLRLNPLDPNRAWNDDDIAITNAVAERAALALEAARLLEDAQKRASREAFLSDVAAKLSTSFQLDSILRDTVEELGQSLTDSTVSFQLVNPSAPPTAERSNGKRVE